MCLFLLQPVGNIVIVSQSHEEAGGSFSSTVTSLGTVGWESLNPTLSWVG